MGLGASSVIIVVGNYPHALNSSMQNDCEHIADQAFGSNKKNQQVLGKIKKCISQTFPPYFKRYQVSQTCDYEP
jgi:hypothetical protein